MAEQDQNRSEVDRFILALIDSVPHLEALLLLWRSRGERWSPEQVAKRLWVKPEAAREILRDLTRDQLVQAGPGPEEQYEYQSDPERDRLIESLEATYRHEMIRISTLIHSKGSSAVREFARAFRLKKEQE